MKVAVLKGDTVCKDLVCVSLYDTKPVYLLSKACEEIKWKKKTKKVYDANKGQTIQMPFYRLNVIDFYNNNMGNVDLADQLRNHYRIDTSWHRNRKWWWSIWWWGFQVLLTNSYIVYTKYHSMLDSKNTVSHYEYIKEVALAWVNREMYLPKVIGIRSKKRKPDDDKPNTRASRKINFDMNSDASITSCIRVNDSTLHPNNGKLSCRLNTTVQHFPSKPRVKRARCALHRWARGREGSEVMRDLNTCTYCQVTLCITCFHTFHKEANLLEMKERIAEE